MLKLNRFFSTVFGSPLVWGAAISVVYYQLLFHGPLGIPFLVRYTATHPVEYVEAVCFFIGISCLLLKAWDVRHQSRSLRLPLWNAVPGGERGETDAESLLAGVKALPDWRQGHYLVRRVREALEFVCTRNSAEGLDNELRRLTDVDAERAYSDQGLLRLIIWAIPILGFLGTVVGITMALTSLKPEALEQSMVEVTAGLGVKFDTTALALTLSIVLMFIHFFIDRAEHGLLERVGRRIEAELIGRFDLDAAAPAMVAGAGNCGWGESTLGVVEEVVRRQAVLWQASMDAAQQRWAKMAEESGKQLQTALAGALTQSLQQHADRLGHQEKTSAENSRRYLEPVQKTLQANAESLVSIENLIGQQAETLARALEATAEITRLEDALNRNLAALAGAQNFEQTVVSLAAALQLLVARLNDAPADGRAVRLDSTRRTPHAA